MSTTSREKDAGRSTPRRYWLPWQVSFVVLATTWGCSFWWIKLGLEYLSPIELAFTRLSLGALALLVTCAVTRTRLPRSRTTWRHLAVVAILLNSVPFALFAYGETHVSSILAGLIHAMTPLATLAVLLIAFPEEKPTRERVIGLVLGFLGVLVVLGVWEGLRTGQLLGSLACVGAVCCYGVAFPYARRHLSMDPETTLAKATGQVVLGAAFLIPALLISEIVAAPQHRGHLGAGTILGMLALGVLSTGFAYILNFQVIDAAGSSTASGVAYLSPIAVVIVGMAFLNEHLYWYEPVGAVIILLGVTVSQGRIHRARAT
ncbi:MAG TPA: DMT family transporter [Acidimicrobiales bacterium]|nr:DMT family transporter [Acidimicrobiales bacterium]